MSDSLPRRTRRSGQLPAEAIVVGYAMSRLDRGFLALIGVRTWRDAYAVVGKAFRVRDASIKNLMQEFDPLHPNPRAGWWSREVRPSRRAVYEELAGLSDEDVAGVVLELLGMAEPAGASGSAVGGQGGRTVSRVREVSAAAEAAAARMKTGRQAEEYFLQHCERIVGVGAADVLDLRDNLVGFDFRLRGRVPWLVEVKGLRGKAGGLLFTNLEWQVAARARSNYVLVVIANLASSPGWHVVHDPVHTLHAERQQEERTSIAWHVRFRVAA